MASYKRRAIDSTFKQIKKRRLVPKAATKRSLAAKVNALIREQEVKFFDTSHAASVVAASGSILESSLCLVQQGDGSSSRDGRKIAGKALYLCGRVTLPAATSGSSGSDSVKIVVYHDKQCNGAAAVVGDLFAQADIDSFFNLNNKGRFVFLTNRTIDINASGVGTGSTPNTVTGEANQSFHWMMPLRDIPFLYDASAGAITDLTTNNIGVVAFSENGLATVQFLARLRYTDS